MRVRRDQWSPADAQGQSRPVGSRLRFAAGQNVPRGASCRSRRRPAFAKATARPRRSSRVGRCERRRAGVIRAPPTNRFSNQVTRSLETNRRHRREEPLRAVLRDVEPAAQSRRDPTSRGCPANPRRPRHDVRGEATRASPAVTDWANRADLERRDATIRKMLPERGERRRCPIRRVTRGVLDVETMPASYGRTSGDVGIVSPPRRKHFSTARMGSPPRVLLRGGVRSGRPESTSPARPRTDHRETRDAGLVVYPCANVPLSWTAISEMGSTQPRGFQGTLAPKCGWSGNTQDCSGSIGPISCQFPFAFSPPLDLSLRRWRLPGRSLVTRRRPFVVRLMGGWQ